MVIKYNLTKHKLVLRITNAPRMHTHRGDLVLSDAIQDDERRGVWHSGRPLVCE